MYFWFDENDMHSLRGCWISWPFPFEDTPRGTKLVFGATTYAGRSHEDLEMQNTVIRALKQSFGGSVYDPQEGRFGHLVNDIPRLGYPEKRCGMVYLSAIRNLNALEQLPQDVPESMKKPKEIVDDFGVLLVHPEIARNNLILVFLVSVLETFLRDLFVAYVDSQPHLWELIYKRGGKMEYQDLRDLMGHKISLAEHESKYYSFQNIEQANGAYERFLQVNLFDTWQKKVRLNEKYHLVRAVIQELLEKRHRIVHDASLDSTLGRQATARYIFVTTKAVDLLATRLEQKGFRVNLERYV